MQETTETIKKSTQPVLTSEDYQLIINALLVANVQVKDAPKVIEVINKCEALKQT